jgi:hypothetical protein
MSGGIKGGNIVSLQSSHIQKFLLVNSRLRSQLVFQAFI